MITKHFPPRKTPDLYSEEYYNEICSDLGSRGVEKNKYFKETLEEAACSLIQNITNNPKRLTDAQEQSEFKRLAKSLKKTREILDSLCGVDQMARFRLFSPLKLNETLEEQKRKAILKEILGNYHGRPKEISIALQALEETAMGAIENPYQFRKQNKTSLVLQWLWYFSDDWEEISEVRFSEGREYDSPALRILKKMIKPINASLPRDKIISDSMLEQAVIMYRQYQKENPNTENYSGEIA